MCPREGKGGPISFKHVGNEAPSNKVATSLTSKLGKSLSFGACGGWD